MDTALSLPYIAWFAKFFKAVYSVVRTSVGETRCSIIDNEDIKQLDAFSRTWRQFFQLISLSPGNIYQLKKLAKASSCLMPLFSRHVFFLFDNGSGSDNSLSKF